MTTTFHPPKPPLQVVLVEPKIPPNTGNIARLCAATGSILHLVEPLGFSITDASLKRAGLDYWDSVEIKFHESWEAFRKSVPPEASLSFFSTKGTRPHTAFSYRPGSYLIFGSETSGLPREILEEQPSNLIALLPMSFQSVRSLNLASSAAIAVYEALRQLHAWIES